MSFPRCSSPFVALRRISDEGPGPRVRSRIKRWRGGNDDDDDGQRRQRERVGDRSGVTDNLTPGLNGLLAHNISRYPGDRIRDITIWKWRGPHHGCPSIGQRTPQARPISVTLMRRIGYTVTVLSYPTRRCVVILPEVSISAWNDNAFVMRAVLLTLLLQGVVRRYHMAIRMRNTQVKELRLFKKLLADQISLLECIH